MISPLLLSRLQFAFAIGFHILWPAYSIGIAAFIAFLNALWLRTNRFTGIAASVYPYVVPYRYTLFEAANDRKTLVFAAVGICIVLPVIVLYLALGYRILRGKSQESRSRATEMPNVSSRKTAGHEADLRLS